MSEQLRRAAVVSPLRTPVGTFGGALRDVPVEDLAGAVVRAAVAASGIDPGASTTWCSRSRTRIPRCHTEAGSARSLKPGSGLSRNAQQAQRRRRRDLAGASHRGHTGMRMVTSLLHEMHCGDGHRGLVTMCIAGGQGMAAIIERD